MRIEVYQLLIEDRGGIDPSRSTKSPHHRSTGVPTIIESPSNSRQEAGFILSTMNPANNNIEVKVVIKVAHEM